MTTIFEKIIRKDIPCDFVFENSNFIVIHDKFPRAPVHLLIIPKKHFSCIHAVPSEELYLISEAFSIIQKMAERFSIADGYKVMINNGKQGGQEIFHLHLHLLGGRKFDSII